MLRPNAYHHVRALILREGALGVVGYTEVTEMLGSSKDVEWAHVEFSIGPGVWTPLQDIRMTAVVDVSAYYRLRMGVIEKR